MNGSAPNAERIKAEAYALGFDLAGIATLGPMPTATTFDEWISRGFAGEMSYLHRGAAARQDSRLPFPGARTAVVVALDYGGREPAGPIARYARGRDYHHVIGGRLRRLHRWIEDTTGRAVPGKAMVDTAPLLERDLARGAGLGWFGKNTMLINPSRGSFFLLGALLLDLDLEPDPPFESDRCGTCSRCIEACPTDAIVAAGVVDSTRCISYLTIELRSGIPRELRPALGRLLFGCDICQDVCPWNTKFAQALDEPEFAPRSGCHDPEPRDLLGLSEGEFRERYSGTAVMRARRRGLARNAAVVMGNRCDPDDVDALCAALVREPDPMVRSHIAWALGRHVESARARSALAAAARAEGDSKVLREIALALD